MTAAINASWEIVDFLVERLITGGPDNVGVSSNEMIACALRGGQKCHVIPRSHYPADWADLARCCRTLSDAPYELRELLAPILLEFIEHLLDRSEHS